MKTSHSSLLRLFGLSRKGLLVILLVLVFGVIASADEPAASDIKSVYISENVQLSEYPPLSQEPDTLPEQLLFFFCGGKISNFRFGDAYFLFGDAVIGENVAGNIYAVFSELKMETINTGLNVKTLFSKVFTPQDFSEQGGMIGRIFDWTAVFGRIYVFDGQNVYDDTISPVLFKLIREIVIVGLFLLFFAIRKSFFEQGALALKREYVRVLKSGISAYFVILCAIVLFLLTVFGIFFSVVIVLIAAVIALIGSAALSLFVGGLIAEKTGMRRGLYAEMVIGVIAIELIAAIPYAGIAVNVVIVPVIALGIVYTALMNMFINKNFYESPYAIG